jgi:NTE family protein
LLTTEELYERQVADPAGEIAARVSTATTFRYAWDLLRSHGDARQFGARMGAMALAADTVDEAVRRDVIAERLVSSEWPDRRLVVTAVDALTGEFMAFDRDSGAGLVDVVAASCAVPGVWPPVTINGRRWIDGGVRSATNADLAAGYRRVVIVAPMAGGTGPIQSAREYATRLTADGSHVALITPDRASRTAFGHNTLDPARRAAAARAGLSQAAAHVDEVAAVWADA